MFSRILDWFRSDPQKKPLWLEARSSKALIIVTVSSAIFVDIFLYAVIVPVIPFALYARAGVAPQDTQRWVSILLAVYGAALLVASPICGWAADRVSSRRWPFVAGLLLVGGATVFLAVGNSIALLVIGRLLQGAAAAIVWTVGLALITDTVPKKDIGQAMGYPSIGMSLAVLVAPLLGGVVFHEAGYYVVFAMCFGLLGVDIVLRLVIVEKKIAKKWIEFEDITQPGANNPVAVESSMEATNIVAPSDQVAPANTEPEDKVEVVDQNTIQPQPRSEAAPEVSGTTKTRRWRLPAVVTLLSSRRMLAALWGCLIQATLLTSFDSTLPLRTKEIFGWNSLGAGLIFLPIVVPTFASPFFGWLSDKYGPRWFATAGFVFCCPFLVLLRLITYDSFSQKAMLCVFLFFLGLFFAMAFAPLMAEITYLIEAKDKKSPGVFGKNGAYAQGYALFNVAYAGGCLIGPIWGGLIKDHAGWGTMCWTLGLLSIVTAIPTALFVGGWLFDKDKRRWQSRSNSKTQEQLQEEQGIEMKEPQAVA